MLGADVSGDPLGESEGELLAGEAVGRTDGEEVTGDPLGDTLGIKTKTGSPTLSMSASGGLNWTMFVREYKARRWWICTIYPRSHPLSRVARLARKSKIFGFSTTT